jgi:nucleoside-diphosphate-sugar epimerase
MLHKSGGAVGAIVSSKASCFPEGVLQFERDMAGLNKAFTWGAESEHPVCIHLAGMANARLCEEQPQNAFQANVAFVWQILECCANFHFKRFVAPSSAYVYGNSCDRPFTENDPVFANNVYTATKIAAESLITSSFNKTFSSLVARLSNVYGPSMSSQTAVGSLCYQIKCGKSPAMENLNPVRDFIFIDDVAESLIKLSLLTRERLNDFDNPTFVNVSTGKGTSIAEMVRMAQAIMDNKHHHYIESPCNARDSLILANEKLLAMSGFIPQIHLGEGLRRMLT